MHCYYRLVLLFLYRNGLHWHYAVERPQFTFEAPLSSLLGIYFLCSLSSVRFKLNIVMNVTRTMLPVTCVRHQCTTSEVESIFVSDIPKFSGPITNVTVSVGREAVLECGVDNLSTFKVSKLIQVLPKQYISESNILVGYVVRERFQKDKFQHYSLVVNNLIRYAVSEKFLYQLKQIFCVWFFNKCQDDMGKKRRPANRHLFETYLGLHGMSLSALFN